MRHPYEFAPLYRRSILVATAIGLTIGAFMRREPLIDLITALWGPPTGAEHTINEAIQSSFGHPVVTHCLSTEELNAGSGFDFAIAAETWHFGPLDVIRVDETVCESVQAFADDPNRHDVQTAQNLTVIAHEVSHVEGVTHAQENVAQCQGIERVGQLAIGLGATPDQAADVAAVAAENYRLGVAEYDTIPDGCHDGGSLDLDLGTRGNFPGNPGYISDGPLFMGPALDTP